MKKHVLKNSIKLILIIAGYVSLTGISANPEEQEYNLDNKVSFVYINGTSTLHDWTVTAHQITGSLKAKIENDHITKINSASVVIPVSSLKSGKELMDKNMHEALKGEKYPQISYQLKEHIVHDGKITTVGELTIAGVKKEVKNIVTQEQLGKHIKIKGKVKLKMTDFNVKPPEFLYGAFTTGNEVTIDFYFMFCDKDNAYSK